jgi:ethanolamine ammonia-lyase small subunit
MRKKGNGEPSQCALNLVSCLRGECCYERLKGVDSSLLGSLSANAVTKLTEDVLWILSTYETRASFSFNEIVVSPDGRVGLALDAVGEANG